MTDLELLRQYVQERSDAAFAELSRRHVDWVYSCALRHVRDPHLAEDVAQATFILLSQKAGKLDERTSLPAWLFRSVRYVSMTALRSERRRKQWERKAADMRPQEFQPEPPTWEELAPLLDEVVARLSKSDQQAVLLRFYQRKSFAEVGQSLNISEEAARKRVARAVEKLRGLFARKGVTVSATALAGLLSAHVTQSASAALVASVGLAGTSAGIGGGALALTKATAAVIAWGKAKVAAVILLTVGLMTGGSYVAITSAWSISGQLQAPDNPAAAIPSDLTSDEPIRGRVQAADGQSVPNATVSLIAPQPSGPPTLLASATTDAIGAYEITPAADWPEEIERLTLVVEAAGYGLTSAPVLHDAQEITMRPATELRLMLRDAQAKPLAGVRVAPRGVGGSVGAYLELPQAIQDRLTQTSDAEGGVILPNLPQGSMVDLNVFDERYARPTMEDRIRLERDARTESSLALVPGATIEGTVRFGPSDRPAGGLTVAAEQSDNGSGWGQAVTDAEGLYRITQLKPGTYHVALKLDRAVAAQWTARALTDLSLDQGQTLAQQDLALIHGATITGRVIAADMARPIPGMIVAAQGPAHPRGGGAVSSIITDTDGRYTLRVPEGRQLIYIASPPPIGYEIPDQLRQEPVVKDGQQLRLDFHLPRSEFPVASIAGKVINHKGRAVAGAQVWAQFTGAEAGPFGRSVSARTDANGAFSFDAVFVGSELRAQHRKLRTEQPLRVVGPNQSLVLTLGSGSVVDLSGVVLDDERNPVPDARVELLRHTGQQAFGFESQRTDAEGRFLFESINTDQTHSLSVSAAGFGRASRTLRLAPGKSHELEPILLTKAHGVVAGRVTDVDGKPKPGVKVSFQGLKSEPQSMTTDDNGRFHFAGVMPDDDLILYAHDERGSPAVSVNAEAGEQDVQIVFRPRRTFTPQATQP